MPSKAAAIAPPICTAPQSRILDAALALFAEHGISGTSLQMIADAIGVTKAAVYHQYNTKDEIVLAVASDVLAALEAAVTAAETWRPRSRARARAVLLDHMVDLAVERRQMAGVLQRDPVMLRFLQEHAPFRRVMERVNRVLLAGSIDPAARVLTGILLSAIAGTVIHPLAMQLDDARLRSQLIRQLRKLLTR
jgi:AcrR family transcriptional regulator